MAIEYLGLSEINGPLIALEGVKDAAFDEIVEFSINDGAEKRLGRIIEIYEDKAIIQVFEGSEGMSLTNTHTKLTVLENLLTDLLLLLVKKETLTASLLTR